MVKMQRPCWLLLDAIGHVIVVKFQILMVRSQQFHCALIFLHRPFAEYRQIISESELQQGDPGFPTGTKYAGQATMTHSQLVSRTVCYNSAVQIARIFAVHRQKFDTARICISGIQHASTAAIILIVSISLMHESDERKKCLAHLQVLMDALRAMSRTYQPAECSVNVLDRVLNDSGWDGDGRPGSAPSPMDSTKQSRGDDPRPNQTQDDFDPAAWMNAGPPFWLTDHMDVMDFLQSPPDQSLNTFGLDSLAE